MRTSEISKEVLEEKSIAISFSKMTDGRAYSLAAKIKEIAEAKMKDLNANTVEAAMKIIMGSARSMGIEVKD